MTAGWLLVGLWLCVIALVACGVAYIRNDIAAAREWAEIRQHQQTMRALTPGDHR